MPMNPGMLPVPPGGGPPNVRPELLPLLTQLWNQSTSQGGGMEDIFNQLSQAVMGAGKSAGEAGTAYQGALNAPMPAMNPIEETILRSMGNAASMFTGNSNGRQSASDLIAGENANLMQKRKDNLAALEGAYQRAAERAAKLGDFETQLKFQTKIDSNLKQQDNINKIMMTGAEADIKAQEARQQHIDRIAELMVEHANKSSEGQAQIGANFALQDMRDKADERQAFIAQGLDPDNPTKPLVGSKANRIATAGRMGFLTTSQYSQRYASLLNAATKGKATFKSDNLRNRYLSELPPDASFAASPDAWLEHMLNEPNPNKRDEPMFPRDARNPQLLSPVWKKKIMNYMHTYWPDWNPAVAAIDSVGK